MAIQTFDDLVTSILAHMGRPGDTNIPVADMITLAEAEFNRFLRTQNQYAFTDITTIGGQQDYALPATISAILEIKLTSTDPIVVLDSMPPADFDETYPFAEAARPMNYTIVGNNISFGPIPDAAYVIRIRYYAKIPALGTTNETNWLLTNNPDVYLFGALRHAQTFLGGDDTDTRLAVFEQRAQAALAAIRLADIRAKTGGSPVRMRSYLRPRDSTFPR